MNNTYKIILNILIFFLIVGFGYYMVHSMISEEKTTQSSEENAENTFVSPYKETNSFNAESDIICFDIYENMIYAALANQVSVFDLSGKIQSDFVIEKDVRDIVIDDATVYLLYPTRIDLYSFEGQKKGGWDAHITIKDAKRRIQMNLNITSSGSATLLVNDDTRQTISFNGFIEERKKKPE